MGKIGFVDDGTCLSAVVRVRHEGHDVRYLLTDPNPKVQANGEGLVKKVNSVEALIKWRPDVVVVYRAPKIAETLQGKGIPTWGSSPEAQEFEDDRMATAELAAELGLAVPETEEFDTLEDARRFVDEAEGEGWVLKAEGGEDDCSTTHVCDSKAQLLALLEHDPAVQQAARFILQEKVHGVEVSTEGWFDYRQEPPWLYPINSTFERKRLFEHDLGPQTGCMGSVVFTWPEPRPRLFREVLEPWTPVLRSVKYVGPFDINAILDERDRVPKYLEPTPRLGWSAFEAVMAGLLGSVGDFFIGLGQGGVRRMLFSHRFMASVKVMHATAADVSVLAPWRGNKHYLLKYVRLDPKRNVLLTTGDGDESGYAACLEVANAGDTLFGAVGPIYDTWIPKIQTPDLAYRKDIGEHAERSLTRLELLGYPLRPDPDRIPGGPPPERADVGIGDMPTPPSTAIGVAIAGPW